MPLLTISLVSLPQGQASEAMEVLDELMESEVSIIVPHLAEIVRFCLEVSAKNYHTAMFKDLGLLQYANIWDLI